MDLTIIIPSFNTKELLSRCLDSIYQSLSSSKIKYEIIVVDNGSIDGTIQLLNKKYPRVIKILNKNNLGYGKANNIGIKKAKGKYILLLNSDILVLENSIDKLFEFVQSHPKAFIGARLINEDGTSQASCGPMYTLPRVFLMLFAKGDAWGATRTSPHETVKTDWVSGACIIAEKESFLEVGLFDEDIFMYMEEIEFLYRAKLKAFKILFFFEAKFIHIGAASSGDKKEPVINIYKGLLYFYHKHRSIIEEQILTVMLYLKARFVILFGKITRNKRLSDIYEKALTLV